MSADVDRLLAKESSLFNTVQSLPRSIAATKILQDREIERVMNSFILDPYSVLDLQPGVPPEEIKKVYRKKSLLIHPDKTKNVRASDAFDRLKKAEAELMDDKKRASLDNLIAAARKALIKEQKYDENSDYIKSDAFWGEVRIKTKQFLIDDELRRRKAKKLQMEQEGRERQEAEAAANEAKRKREADKEWEETREDRVNNWRTFAKTGPEKKKKKMKVLG
jgi:DnaJ homolog subfamily C member 8